MNQSLVEAMLRNQIRPTEINHLSIYEEFVERKAKGEKISYIAATLADKCGLKERAIYAMVARFEDGVDL